MHTRVNVLPKPAQPKNTPPTTAATALADYLAAMYRFSSAESTAVTEYDCIFGWIPLEKLLPSGRCADFMFMGSANGIYQYKHVDTRRYLNVDIFGATYAFNAETSNYDPISREAALVSCLGRCCIANARAI